MIDQSDTAKGADLDHDDNLKNLLHCCRMKNIKLSREKFQFKCIGELHSLVM